MLPHRDPWRGRREGLRGGLSKVTFRGAGAHAEGAKIRLQVPAGFPAASIHSPYERRGFAIRGFRAIAFTRLLASAFNRLLT
jgi:hypothetical protein